MEDLPEGYEEVIDKVYEDTQAVVDALDTGDDDILEHYDGFDSSSELLNFIEDNIVLGEEDINRVLESYENPKCDKCFEILQDSLDGGIDEDIDDPTLETESWTIEDNSYKVDNEGRFTNVVLAYCKEHGEVFIEYEEVIHD